MARGRNVRRIQWIANDNARHAALRRGRAKLHHKAEELSSLSGSSIAVVTQGPDEAAPTVWPPVSEAVAVLQRYAGTDSSSRDLTLSHEEFLGQRIAKLEKQVKNQKATNDEAMAKLALYDVLQGNKDIGDVPLELQADFMKVVEKRMQEAAATIYLRSLKGAAPAAGQRR